MKGGSWVEASMRSGNPCDVASVRAKEAGTAAQRLGSSAAEFGSGRRGSLARGS